MTKRMRTFNIVLKDQKSWLPVNNPRITDSIYSWKSNGKKLYVWSFVGLLLTISDEAEGKKCIGLSHFSFMVDSMLEMLLVEDS